MSEPRSFDVCGPLPTGVTVLEASAGTGKTYTIAALAARYVAAGLPLDELLLVTFTRMATGELRERVRERLVQAEQALARGSPGSRRGGDEVVELLADGTPEEVVLRRERLVRALADFDAATIATTHGFCREALSGLGIVGDVERGRHVVEDVVGPPGRGRRRPLRPALPRRGRRAAVRPRTGDARSSAWRSTT